MALFARGRSAKPVSREDRSPRVEKRRAFRWGLAGLLLLAVVCYFAFTKANPLASPYELKAVFESANSLQKRSPVRIAGVAVGKVTEVEPLEDGSGKALVTMEIEDEGLPIKRDATLKVRSRLFLEGNYFVDVQPGSPSAEELPSGATVPVQQTAFPVQFSQVLQALQSDTRQDLQTFLREYSKALDEGGAEGFNQAIPYWEDAYRDTALVSRATLGTEPHDLSRLLRGQARVFGALSSDEDALKGLVVNLNRTAAAFAIQEDNLRAAIPRLRNVVRVGRPALKSLNSALPPLRGFARDALPGARSSPATLDAQLPFLIQARQLVSERELGGLTKDLRATVPRLVSLNKGSERTFQQTRALSSCQNRVLLPFAKAPIPDPDFPKNSGEPWYEQAARSFVGLSGESRLSDANSAFFRVQVGGGPETIASTGETGEQYFAQLPFKVDGVRPARPVKRPGFRPDIPCETQDPPNLNAVKGVGDQSVTATAAPSVADRKRTRRGLLELREVADHLRRTRSGRPSVDPLSYGEKGEQRHLKRLGLERRRPGAPLAKEGERP